MSRKRSCSAVSDVTSTDFEPTSCGRRIISTKVHSSRALGKLATLTSPQRQRPDSQYNPSPYFAPSVNTPPPFANTFSPAPAQSASPISQSPFLQPTTSYFAHQQQHDPPQQQQQQLPQLQSQSSDISMTDVPCGNDQSTTTNTDYGDNLHQQQRYKERMLDLRGPQPAWHEEQKPKFRLGFKADCQKCLMKVPGHYAHA